MRAAIFTALFTALLNIFGGAVIFAIMSQPYKTKLPATRSNAGESSEKVHTSAPRRAHPRSFRAIHGHKCSHRPSLRCSPP